MLRMPYILEARCTSGVRMGPDASEKAGLARMSREQSGGHRVDVEHACWLVEIEGLSESTISFHDGTAAMLTRCASGLW